MNLFKSKKQRKIKINRTESDIYALMGSLGISPSKMMEYSKLCNGIKKFEKGRIG